jgi:hypothetical protein
MAIGTGAAILGGSIISGVMGARSAKKAAKAQEKGDAAAIAEQRRQFDTIMGLQRPYNVTGVGALGKLAQLYGLPYAAYAEPGAPAQGQSGVGPRVGGSFLGRPFEASRDASRIGAPAAGNGITTPAGPDLSVFQESPDYQFRQREGTNAIERTAAARSGAVSGNVLRENAAYSSDLASLEFGNFFNRLATIAGLGQGAANTASNAASATGSNISQLLQNSGDARASGILGMSNSIGGALNSGLNNYLLMRGGYFGSPGAGSNSSNNVPKGRGIFE